MMKVGSKGSIPDNVTKTEGKPANQGSIARQELLNTIGESVASINTIAVGLSAVENGAERPDGLDISWNPADRTAAARKARKFAVQAVMVQAVEAINQYVYAIAKLPRFAALRASWKSNDTSMAERFIEIANELNPERFTIEMYGVALMIHWRNRFVHASSNAKLKHHEKKYLYDHEEDVSKKYAGLSVDCLLCHFQEMRPTLKDISSLVAMTINAANAIDEMIYECKTKDDVETWLHYYEIDAAIERVTKQTKPEKLVESIKRTLLTRAPQLVEPYFKYVMPLEKSPEQVG